MLPKIISGKIAPPNMLLIRHPKNTPGIPAGVIAGRIVSASEKADLHFSECKRCAEHSQYDVDCGDHRRLCHEKALCFVELFSFFNSPLVLFYVWKVTNTRFIFRETMSHVEVLAHPFGECRESQIPQVFGLRRKSAKPL